MGAALSRLVRPSEYAAMTMATIAAIRTMHTDLRYATAVGLEYDEGICVHRGERRGMGIESPRGEHYPLASYP
eukprot:SAG11_NODE_1877_length_4133_cov_20.873079_2_plen_73_part_00